MTSELQILDLAFRGLSDDEDGGIDYGTDDEDESEDGDDGFGEEEKDTTGETLAEESFE